MNMDFPGLRMASPCRASSAFSTPSACLLTAGNVSAYVVLDREDQPYQGTDNSVLGGYPAGITVSN
jgi:hypothetical protein